MTPQERIVATARSQEGYIAKKSASMLDDFLLNAGGKYNKYARDLDALGDFYNGKKQGFDWCDIFVDWCFVTTFGREMAQRLLNQGDRSCGAGCKYSKQFFEKMGRLYTIPQIGDQAFFGTNVSPYHTGLVVDKDKYGYVYIMEGNSGTRSMVQCCKYKIGGGTVTNYGRPDWSIVPAPTIPTVPTVSKKEEEDMIPTYKKFEDIPSYYQAAVKKAIDQKALLGTGNDELNVSEDLCRTLTVLDRLGQLDRKE